MLRLPIVAVAHFGDEVLPTTKHRSATLYFDTVCHSDPRADILEVYRVMPPGLKYQVVPPPD